MPTCLIEPFELRNIHEVLKYLSHVLRQSWSIVIVVYCWISDVQAKDFNRNLLGLFVFEDQTQMWKLLWVELGQLWQIRVSHIHWKILCGLHRVKLAKIMLNELSETVVIWWCVAIATNHEILWPELAALVVLSNLLDFLHMLLFLLDLLDEVLILERSVVKRLDEILAVDVFKRGKLIEFLILELLQLAT